MFGQISPGFFIGADGPLPGDINWRPIHAGIAAAHSYPVQPDGFWSNARVIRQRAVQL